MRSPKTPETQPIKSTLADLKPDLDKALALAKAARQAAERGDREAATRLRAEHDAIFEALQNQADG